MTTPKASIFSLAAGFLGGWLLYLRVAARQKLRARLLNVGYGGAHMTYTS